jgi:phage tail-like protein
MSNGAVMPEFTVNPQRVDPYKDFKFRVKWDGRVVAGVDRVSALARTTAVFPHREGGDPNGEHLSPGLTTFAPVVLSRGRTHDSAFEEWAEKVWRVGAAQGEEVSLADFRKDIVVDLMNEAGQVVLSWKVYRCWPSEYVALGDLDAAANGVVVESLTLQHEGWERDTAVTEPKELTVKTA